MKPAKALTAQRESAARALVEGRSKADAFRAAFPHCAAWQPKTVHERASKLFAEPAMVARVAELQAELAERSILKADDILRETARLCAASPAKLVRRAKVGGKEQVAFLMPDELDPETAAAVASFEIDEVGRVKYKFWDKNAALDRASKILGLYEKDNQQRGAELAALWGRLSGNVMRPDPAAADPDPDAIPGDGDDA